MFRAAESRPRLERESAHYWKFKNATGQYLFLKTCMLRGEEFHYRGLAYTNPSTSLDSGGKYIDISGRLFKLYPVPNKALHNSCQSSPIKDLWVMLINLAVSRTNKLLQLTVSRRLGLPIMLHKTEDKAIDTNHEIGN